jgi:hypothetical protein
MISEITLVGNALNLIGADRISSFEDDSTEAEVTKNIFETTYIAMLTETRWRFATKDMQLARLLEEPDPVYGYDYAFALPSDYLQLNEATTKDYQIVGQNVLTNSKELTITYTFRPPVHNLPGYFIKALEYNLAANFAIPITDDRTKLNDFMSLYTVQLKRAKFSDASSNPPRIITSSPYITARA